MAFIPIRAMVAKDLRLFFGDRRSVIMAFAMPIAIASFFGYVFSGPKSGNGPSGIAVDLVNQDTSSISNAIVASVKRDKNLTVKTTTLDSAQARVRKGTAPVGVVIPIGFGAAAGRAFFRGTDRPQLIILYDPSRNMERAMASGLMTQHVMEAVSQEMFSRRGQGIIDDMMGDLSGSNMPPLQQALLRQMIASVKQFNNSDTASSGTARQGLSMPYDVKEEAMNASMAPYNGYAHSFAGMGIQFLLFSAINLAVELLAERQRGLWKRLRSAPVSRASLLGGKLGSSALIGALVLFVSFAFAIAVWKVRIMGSMAGFLGVGAACALMAAGYGLLIASLGKTPNAARGMSIFATLIMVMLGGAWVPTFVFPQWLQQATIVVPTRWAVDGFDAMTWRGLGIEYAVWPIVVLLGFAALFTSIAVWRFRWEEA